VSSVTKVLGVTSKVLEMVPLAEPAAKAFEHAASVLEEVQVPFFPGVSSPMVYTDKRANVQAILGEYRHHQRSDSSSGAHSRLS
jgi:hypothetical protein